MKYKREDLTKKVTEIFRNVFDDDLLIISDLTTAKDIDDWDSLAQINLILAIEATFKLRFSPVEIEPLENIGDMINLIMLKLSC
jgi:acyl carrier protein